MQSAASAINRSGVLGEQGYKGFIAPASESQRFSPETNVTRLHPSYYSDPEVQQMEQQERDRVKNMEWDAQASANRAAARTGGTDSATTSTRGRRRNGARSSTNLRKTLDYLRAL
jgi:hypothetical protein